ncbi:MAG: efflux RND transporter permease subunit [Myxococcota bacterium]
MFEALIARPRLVLALGGLFSIAGVAAWGTMAREEDPRLSPRAGLVVAVYPGADVLEVERLVAVPVEEELAEVAEIDTIDTTIRPGVAILSIQLLGEVTDTGYAWDEVEDALERSRRELPAEVLSLDLDRKLIDTESVVVALTSDRLDRIGLMDEAERLERALLSTEGVSRVAITGDPKERIVVDVDDATARRLGLSMERLRTFLTGNNATIPGGALRAGGQQLILRPGATLNDLEELRALPVPVGRPETREGLAAGLEGSAVPLSVLADVQRRSESPASERVRMGGQDAVLVGVIPVAGQQAEQFGARVQQTLDDFAAATPGLSVTNLAFQPERVATRLSELGRSLLVGVGIVALVLITFMGLRLGLVVAGVVPLVTFASIAAYAFGGGVLHQMAVAALVIALGLLVDNAIVVAETMQRRLDEGQKATDAMRATVAEMKLPLGAATGTTLASFVPMLLAPGTTGDFTRAIPIVVMLTLTVSYFYALLVTPILCRFGLKKTTTTKKSRFDAVAARIGRLAGQRPWLTLGASLGVLFLCGSFALGVRQNFFPTSDRNQVMVTVELDEGAHPDATDAASRRLERWLLSEPNVQQVTAVVGRSAPRFYYNLPRIPSAPHVAQILVTTEEARDVDPLRAALERFAAEAVPEALVIAKRLEQGPPTAAPVEIRVFHEDLSSLQAGAEAVRRVLATTPGTRHVRHDGGTGTPTVRYATFDEETAVRGVARQSLAASILQHSSGLAAGSFRAGRDPVPIVLRSRAYRDAPRGERTPLTLIDAADVHGNAARPLSAYASNSLEWQPSVIHHRNGRRVVHVLAEHDADRTYNRVFADATPALAALDLPPGARWEVGGALGESGKANGSLGAYAPLAALLLIGILLAEFNSFRRVFIVLMTAPLAVLGIWPGLFALDLPFGFVALLGAIALIGIAVNGAIVLLDVTELKRKEGRNVEDALTEAVRLRARPILLTTATTIAGLCPLLLSESTLWPPMAAAMISGLLVATLLTLGVVPSLYRVLFRDPKASAA